MKLIHQVALPKRFVYADVPQRVRGCNQVAEGVHLDGSDGKVFGLVLGLGFGEDFEGGEGGVGAHLGGVLGVASGFVGEGLQVDEGGGGPEGRRGFYAG